ncbi:MAG: lysozyme inhibitor LprI family protein [Alphaproteobacteria bacterium]|nr:lysozyme inhibitor LprI family protein [Alphaproteobacteria bacterium]
MKSDHQRSIALQTVGAVMALLTGLFLAFSSSPGLAQDINCNSPQTQLDMNICAQRDFEKADAVLNSEYAKARDYMKSLDENLSANSQGAAKALLDAQRAWITYRDLACAADGFVVKGGTMEPMIISTCKARLTRQRIGDLRQLIDFK